MNKLINVIFQNTIYCKVKKIAFYFLAVNVLLFPNFSYISNPIVLIVCNFFEYSNLIFAFYFFFFHLKQKDKKNEVVLPFIIFIIFIIYSFLSTLILYKIGIQTVKELLKMLTCASFLFVTKETVSDKKKILFLLITFLISIVIMFCSTFYYNRNSLNNIILAFTGGKYRFGQIENQSNGYAVFCILAIFSLLLFYEQTKKVYLLFLSFIPSIFCIGTQSKKGVFITFILFLFILYKLMKKLIKNKKILFSVFAIMILLFIIALTVISRKTNIFDRVLNMFNGTDASTKSRLDMFQFTFYDSANSLFIGHGLGSFTDNFYRFSGIKLTFHSSLGYTFYSSGLLGLGLWISFIFSLFKKTTKNNGYFALLILFIAFLILNDLTMQIWSLQIIFIFIGIFSVLSSDLNTKLYYEVKI